MLEEVEWSCCNPHRRHHEREHRLGPWLQRTQVRTENHRAAAECNDGRPETRERLRLADQQVIRIVDPRATLPEPVRGHGPRSIAHTGKASGPALVDVGANAVAVDEAHAGGSGRGARDEGRLVTDGGANHAQPCTVRLEPRARTVVVTSLGERIGGIGRIGRQQRAEKVELHIVDAPVTESAEQFGEP